MEKRKKGEVEVLTVDKLPRAQKENSRQESTLSHHSAKPDTPRKRELIEGKPYHKEKMG